MTPHGPDTATFENAILSDSDQPAHLSSDTLAFMVRQAWGEGAGRAVGHTLWLLVTWSLIDDAPVGPTAL